MPKAEGVEPSVAELLRSRADYAAEYGPPKYADFLRRMADRLDADTPAPAHEVRREWRVWVTAFGPGIVWGAYDDAEDAAIAAKNALRCTTAPTTVEIEEREIITRVVERRVVPRTEEE